MGPPAEIHWSHATLEPAELPLLAGVVAAYREELGDIIPVERMSEFAGVFAALDDMAASLAAPLVAQYDQGPADVPAEAALEAKIQAAFTA